MRKPWLAAFFVLQAFLALPAAALPCPSAPLATYATAGFSCTVGALDFSDFQLLAMPTGALPFPSLTLQPVADPGGDRGLAFVVNQNAAAGERFQQLIGYRVRGVGAAIVANTVALVGSASSGDGVVSALEQKCLEGAFLGPDGVTGCSGILFNQVVLDILGTADPPASLDFAPVAFLSVVSDIAVDGGLLGTAELLSVLNVFRPVEEPAGSALAALGVLLLIVLRASGAPRR